jgi:hypothetical protein
MISWKHSFEELNEEYEMTKKKEAGIRQSAKHWQNLTIYP